MTVAQARAPWRRRAAGGRKLDAPRMNESPMRLNLNFAWGQRMLADAAVAAYSEWRGECAAVRTSYRQWTEVLVSRGPALESVIAAASIPGVFPPVKIGDLRLVGGSVVNNLPISHAVELVVL